jgi:hypothetical protein
MFEVRNIKFGDGKPVVAVPIIGKSEAEICSEAAGARGEAGKAGTQGNSGSGHTETSGKGKEGSSSLLL